MYTICLDENILLRGNRLKLALCDFGIAQCFNLDDGDMVGILFQLPFCTQTLSCTFGIVYTCIILRGYLPLPTKTYDKNIYTFKDTFITFCYVFLILCMVKSVSILSIL